MSIPKIIHYCWFGGNPKPELFYKCLESWKKYCPDWEIKEWNENNFDVNFCTYSSRAYQQKRWGYVTDPIRFKIIYENGGVYMDTDAELTASIDQYLEFESFFGYATKTEIGSGLGFGAEKHHPFIKTILDHYTSLPTDSKFIVSTQQETPLFKKNFPEFWGSTEHKKNQLLGNGSVLIVYNTWKYTVHHYTGSWQSPLQRAFNKSKIIKPVYIWFKKKIKGKT